MAEPMRALTLTPEWAWAVCNLDKRVENRTWRPRWELIGTTIALHAGKSRPDWEAVDLMAGCAGWRVQRLGHVYQKPGQELRAPSDPIRGAIVATFKVTGIRMVSQESAVGWEVGPVCWHLSQVRLLASPVPCRGALGLWTVPADIAARVLEAPRG